jgi:hypothetical protein
MDYRFRVITFCRHHERKRVIQYAGASAGTTTVIAYWMPACAGMTVDGL